jgi:uncharacterized protein (DUF58 family)
VGILRRDFREKPMQIIPKLSDRLENRWAAPAYSGWVLFGIGLCFFGAATNTMAGWLYVLSGIIAALLCVNAWSAARSLRHLVVERAPITPVSAGDDLTIQLAIANPSKTPQILLQIQDILPYVFQTKQSTALEVIPAQGQQEWVYYLPTQKRGVYHWQEVQLRTGNPLGLFWASRLRPAPAKAIVYPQILPLVACPLIDSIGQKDSTRNESTRRYLPASEGVTRTLRPYRYGDPTRLIHWRTSARLGDFKVRELEVIKGSQDVVIGLDSYSSWVGESFEIAVIAAASLYFYASRAQMNVQLWTAKTGLVQGNRVVLETLAAVTAAETKSAGEILPEMPIIWLTGNAATLESLNPYSRWAFFRSGEQTAIMSQNLAGITINTENPLGPQLQQALKKV